MVEQLTAREQKQNVEILSPLGFILDLRQHIYQAKDHIYIQSMKIDWYGHAVGLLYPALLDAAKKGIHIELNYDQINEVLIENSLRHLRHEKYLDMRNQQNQQIFEQLLQAGVKTNISHPYRSTSERLSIFSGRNHIKAFLVDQTAWLGGLQLSEDLVSRCDFMLKITSPSIISTLNRLTTSPWPNKNTHIQCDSQSSLILDSGRESSSRILDHMCASIGKAKSTIDFVSAHDLDDPLGKELVSAQKRGVKVRYYSSDPFIKRSGIETWHFPSSANRDIAKYFYPNQRVHAKVLRVDDSVYIGSHNGTSKSRFLHTREMQLVTTESSIVSLVQKWVDQRHHLAYKY